jgi:hypothetical protein
MAVEVPATSAEPVQSWLVRAHVAIQPLPVSQVRVEDEQVTFSAITDRLTSEGIVEDAAAAPRTVDLRRDTGECRSFPHVAKGDRETESAQYDFEHLLTTFERDAGSGSARAGCAAPRRACRSPALAPLSTPEL